MLLELFAVQVGTAVDRISEADSATDRVSLYGAAFVESPLATALVDSDLRLVDVNEAFRMLTDAVPDHITGRLLADYLETDPADLAARVDRLESGEAATVVRESLLRDSRGRAVERWVDVSIRRIDGVHDDPRYVCSLIDQTASRAEMQTIRHRADHDALTGLTTRPVWLAEIETRLTARARDPAGAAVIGVLFCDLDGFKAVNDADGHAAGDGVLVAVADVLRRACGTDDALCRSGGDEFAVAATRASVDDLSDLATSITATTAESSESGRRAAVTISVGVAALLPTGSAAEPLDLVDAADKALYTAKRRGRSTTWVTRL